MDDHDRTYYRKPWMSDGQWECAKMVAATFGGFHHVVGEFKEFGAGVAVSVFSGLATFDSDRLTRLVFLAHDRCIRVEIAASSPGRVKLCLWQRAQREGDTCRRHPTIEQALEVHRRYFPANQTERDGAEAKPSQEVGRG